MTFCKDHFSGQPTLPCAWPGCKNGTSDATIAGLCVAGEKATPWERGFLESFDGRSRYFWRQPDGGWWEVATQLRNHEIGRLAKAVTEDTSIYHYTTLGALKSIIENQELWLTDYEYLNDASEIRHGVEVAREVFAVAVSDATAESAAVLSALLDIPRDQLPRICVSCFSTPRDSLTQWKGYGGGQAGVAIAIQPRSFLEGLGYPRELQLAEILYDPTTKRQVLQGFFHDWAALRDKDMAAGSALPGLYESLPRGYFVELLAMMKDDAFSDERELRYVYMEDASGLLTRFHGRALKRFRTSGHLLVPYTTTKDLSNRSSIGEVLEYRLNLHEVIVGPHPHKDLIVSGLREFLDEHGYQDVVVSPSKIPFR
jgi:hypothetical protein